MTKRILSLLLIATIVFVTIPALAQDTDILELSPSDGSTVYKLPDYFTVNPEGASEVVFELDGKYLGKADGYGKIAAPDLAYGAHTLKATAIVPGGTAICEESTFLYEKSTVLSSHIEDFNDLDGNVDNLSADFYMVDEPRGDFSLVKGASGEAGDYALSVNKKQGLPYIQSKLFTNYSQGNTEIEFDIKFNSIEDTMRISSLFLWCEGIEVITGGKWTDTDEPITDEWTNIKIIQNNLEQKVSFVVNGNTIINNAPFAGDKRNSDFRLTCTTSDNAAVRGGFTIDNLRAECLMPKDLVNNAAYVYGGTEHAIHGSIPANSEKIRVYFKNGLLSANAADVSLATSYGAKAALSGVSYDSTSNVLELTPSGSLIGGTSYVLSLAPAIKLADGTAIGSNYEIRFSTANTSVETTPVFTVNGFALTTASQIDYGSYVSANVTAKNVTGAPLTITYFLTLRKDGALHSVKAEKLTLAGGVEQSFTLSLPEVREYYGEYEVYLFNCTDFSDISAVESFIQIK